MLPENISEIARLVTQSKSYYSERFTVHQAIMDVIWRIIIAERDYCPFKIKEVARQWKWDVESVNKLIIEVCRKGGMHIEEGGTYYLCVPDFAAILDITIETDIDLPWEDETFREYWQRWLSYRKERRLPSYKPTGLKALFTELRALSGNNSDTACKIILQSITKNWQGLFPLKQEYGKTTYSSLKGKISQQIREANSSSE